MEVSGEDFIEDETFLERVIALKEIFPESLRNVADTLTRSILGATKASLSKGKTGAWW